MALNFKELESRNWKREEHPAGNVASRWVHEQYGYVERPASNGRWRVKVLYENELYHFYVKNLEAGVKFCERFHTEPSFRIKQLLKAG